MLLKHISYTVLSSGWHKGTLESSLLGNFVMEWGGVVKKNNSKRGRTGNKIERDELKGQAHCV